MINFVDPVIDCVWGDWNFSTCSKTCGLGVMTVTRSISQPAVGPGAMDCVGEDFKIISCHEESCSDNERKIITGVMLTIVAIICGLACFVVMRQLGWRCRGRKNVQPEVELNILGL